MTTEQLHLLRKTWPMRSKAPDQLLMDLVVTLLTCISILTKRWIQFLSQSPSTDLPHLQVSHVTEPLRYWPVRAWMRPEWETAPRQTSAGPPSPGRYPPSLPSILSASSTRNKQTQTQTGRRVQHTWGFFVWRRCRFQHHPRTQQKNVGKGTRAVPGIIPLSEGVYFLNKWV